MAKRISVDVRRELVRAIGERYRSGSVDGKTRILDEFVAVTGYHRKHSIRVLNSAPAATVTARRRDADGRAAHAVVRRHATRLLIQPPPGSVAPLFRRLRSGAFASIAN